MRRLMLAMMTLTVVLASSQPLLAGPSTVHTETRSRATLKRLNAKKGTYVARHHTIGHRILNLETPLGGVTGSMYELLDSLIDQASMVIKPKLPKEVEKVSKDQARAIFQDLDNLLVARNFAYPVAPLTPDGLTATLTDGLTPRLLKQTEVTLLANAPHNERRKEHILKNADKPFYLVDCDIASYLYLSIADDLRLPMYMVEIPEHNFVRWYMHDESYFNWETMDGIEESDQFYISTRRIPQVAIDKGIFMSKMTREDVIGYEHFVVGIGFYNERNWAKAIEEYDQATRMYNRSPSAWNNLAWVLVTARDARLRDGKRAVRAAKAAVERFISDNNLDTLAWAYAEAGDFAKAIQTEQQAYRLNPTSEYAAAIAGFRERKTWIDQHPEGTTEPRLLIHANR